MKTVGPCTKCGGRMSAGFTLDQGHYNMVRVPTWQPGEPVKSFWAGGFKQVKAEQKAIATYRCDRCGILESYAN